MLEQLPFIEGYGVDLGLLIDIEARFGLGAMAQVDLGRRVHRNRPLDQLSPQAMAVLQAALHRDPPPTWSAPPRCWSGPITIRWWSTSPSARP